GTPARARPPARPARPGRAPPQAAASGSPVHSKIDSGMAERPETYERGDETNALGFKRHFVLPGLVLTALELIGIVWPLLSLFQAEVPDRAMLLKIAIPVVVGAQLTWWAALGSWLTPIYRAIQ